MYVIYFALLLSHGALLSLAVNCTAVVFAQPSTTTPNPNYSWGDRPRLEFGGWSDEEVKECLGSANSYNIWLVSNDDRCPYVWLLYEEIEPRKKFDSYGTVDISKDNLVWSPFHFDLRKASEEYDVNETLYAVSGGFGISDDSPVTSYTTITSTSTTSYTTLTTASSTSESILTPVATIIVTKTLEPTATHSIPVNHKNAGLSTGAKAGIGAGVAAGAIGLAAAAYLLLLLRRRRRANQVMPMVSGHESNKYSPPGPPEMHDEVPGSLPVVSETGNNQKRPPSEMLGSIPAGKPSGRGVQDGVTYELP
ncbi:hypothetical protein McanMca71_005135 [Microsporum canis]|uniref:Mid2 domain-containing protein n=1 Tax=Arthroderma otae (strain ATCC MYA-4605 / CBS 113480) TaxID=554155 RepID=C5FDW6_ARTOC|nr:uncharacterized protein MCYG_00888 [Microsporum canis CBS 113480]EEQ28000.1 predicted protein [Microsporum canis CBS 113480]